MARFISLFRFLIITANSAVPSMLPNGKDTLGGKGDPWAETMGALHIRTNAAAAARARVDWRMVFSGT
jgi:hypothetical protein